MLIPDETYGNTPVFLAATGDHAEAIKALKKLGADLNTPGVNGATPIYAAALKRHSNAVATLYRLGATTSTSNGESSWADRFVKHSTFNAVITLSIFGVPITLLVMLFFYSIVTVMCIGTVLLLAFYQFLKVIGTRWGHFEALRMIEEVVASDGVPDWKKKRTTGGNKQANNKKDK